MSADYSGGSSDALSRICFCVNPIDFNRAYPERGAMSEMRYAYTIILIVTCYLLLQGLERCCASILPPLQVPFYSHSKARTWNGITAESQWTHDGTASEGLPEHFSRLYIVFQAYRKPEIMLVVMLLRLSAAYTLPCNYMLTASLSLL